MGNPEFQKILDHRGSVQNCPTAAVARFGLARAYAMLGDSAKAKAVYQDFITLWQDADADIPIPNGEKLVPVAALRNNFARRPSMINQARRSFVRGDSRHP